jgi:hypothetical protein
MPQNLHIMRDPYVCSFDSSPFSTGSLPTYPVQYSAIPLFTNMAASKVRHDRFNIVLSSVNWFLTSSSVVVKALRYKLCAAEYHSRGQNLCSLCPSSWSVRRLLVTANVVPTTPILVTLMKEALSSSETSVVTKATRRNIQEDGILHSHRLENLKSYIALTGWAL